MVQQFLKFLHLALLQALKNPLINRTFLDPSKYGFEKFFNCINNFINTLSLREITTGRLKQLPKFSAPQLF